MTVRYAAATAAVFAHIDDGIACINSLSDNAHRIPRLYPKKKNSHRRSISQSRQWRSPRDLVERQVDRGHGETRVHVHAEEHVDAEQGCRLDRIGACGSAEREDTLLAVHGGDREGVTAVELFETLDGHEEVVLLYTDHGGSCTGARR